MMYIFVLFFIYFCSLNATENNIQISEEIEYLEQYEHDEYLSSLNQDKIIYIQTCSIEDLTEDNMLSEEDAIRLIEYRDKNGIKDWHDIHKSGIKIDNITQMKHLIIYKKGKEMSRVELLYQLRRSGEDDLIRSKTEMQREYWFASICTEKDYSDDKLIDHGSFSLLFKNDHPQRTFLKELSFGNYSLQSGKGVLLGQNQNRTKSSINGFSQVSRASYLESKTFNGVNALFQFRSFYLLSFYSAERLYLTLDSLRQIERINLSGLNKEESMDQAHLITYGAILEKRMPRFIGGVQYYQQEYPYSFADRSKKKVNDCMSHYARYSLRNINFEYEWARGNDLVAYTTSLRLKGSINQELQYRYYDQYFPDSYGNPYSHKAAFPNEKGISYTLSFKIRQINYEFITDQYQYIEAVGTHKHIQNGSENYVRMETRLDNNILNILFRYRISDAVLDDIETEKKKLSTTLAYKVQNDKKTACQYQVIYSQEIYDEIEKKHQSLTFIHHYYLYFQQVRFKFSGIHYQNDDARYLTDTSLNNSSETILLKDSGFQVSCQVKFDYKEFLILYSNCYLQRDADRKWGLSLRVQMIL